MLKVSIDLTLLCKKPIQANIEYFCEKQIQRIIEQKSIFQSRICLRFSTTTNIAFSHKFRLPHFVIDNECLPKQ